MTHKMNLNPEPSSMVKNGKKTIELRLNDEKRRKLKIGDNIEFFNTESGEAIVCEIINIYKFSSFNELYKALPLLKCGYTEEDISSAKPEDMDFYYSREQQKKYGVLGIEIKRLVWKNIT